MQGKGPRLIVTGYEPDMGWDSGCESITYEEAFATKLPANREVSFVRFAHGRLQRSESSVRELVGDRPFVITEVRAAGNLGTQK